MNDTDVWSLIYMLRAPSSLHSHEIIIWQTAAVVATSRDAKISEFITPSSWLYTAVTHISAINHDRVLNITSGCMTTWMMKGAHHSTLNIHHVSKKRPTFSLLQLLMDFDIFGNNVTDKVGNQKTLYYATSNNLCFCTTWQNMETRKSHISLKWFVLHTMHPCAIFLKEKIVICDVFDSV